MQARPLVDQEFIAHLFVPTNGPDAASAYRGLQEVWRRCRDDLAMCQPIAGTGLPTALPGALDAIGARPFVAAVESAEGHRQAVLRHEQTVLNLSVLFAHPGKPARWSPRRRKTTEKARPGWRHFDETWNLVVTGQTRALFGEVRLYLGTVAGRRPRVQGSAAQAESVAGALPSAEAASEWSRRGVTVPAGFAVWETSAVSDAAARRRLLVLGRHGRDRDLSAWVWSDGALGMPPLARYLMYAAIVRYEGGVYEAAERPGALAERTVLAADALRPPFPGPLEADRIGSDLDRLRKEEYEVAKVTDDLEAMRLAVQAAMANMADALAVDHGRTGADLLSEDRALGRRLEDQLGDDIARLEAVRRRAARTRAIARDALDQRRTTRSTDAAAPVDAPDHGQPRSVPQAHAADDQVVPGLLVEDPDQSDFDPHLRTQLDTWAKSNGWHIEITRWFTRGTSGSLVAHVYRTECRGRYDPKGLVLKVSRRDAEGTFEAARAREAWQDAPDSFRRHHLVEPVGDASPLPSRADVPNSSAWHAMFFTLAGRSSKVTPLAEIDVVQRPEYYRLIVRSILDEWDVRRPPRPISMTLAEYLHTHLGDRMDPGTALAEWVARTHPHIVPIVQGTSRSDVKLHQVQRGGAQGDLNLENVLYGRPPTPDLFWLIDYARYSREAPLARDPAQLLLYLVASRLPEAPERRSGLRAALIGSDDLAARHITTWERETIAAFFEIPERCKGLEDEWSQQRSFSLAACALKAVGRDVTPDGDRDWHLQLAADAMKTGLDMVDGR